MGVVHLDLEKIDKLDLNNPDDVRELGMMVNSAYKGSQSHLRALAVNWERNIHFYLGNHYLRFDNNYFRFEPIPTNRHNGNLPRPVTNYIKSVVETLVSVLTRQKPNASIFPNSTDESDINAAKLAERLQDYKWELDDEQRNMIKSVWLATVTGTAIRKDCWDPNRGPINDLTGERVGDNKVEILSPFNFIPDMQNESWFLETTIKPVTWIRNEYGKQGNGYTGEGENVKEDRSLSSVMEVFNRLQTAIETGYGSLWSGAEPALNNRAVVIEGYIKPTNNHPNGIHVVVADGRCLYAYESKYNDPRDQNSWHPYSFFKYYDPVIRWHGVGAIDEGIQLNKRINSIDAIQILNRKTMASPQWLIPKGSGIPEGYLSGESGLVVTWDPNGSGGSAPSKLPGMDITPGVFEERKMLVEEIYRLSGTNEVLGGYQPSGVGTAAALEMLIQQSYSKQSPIIQRWEKYVENSQTKKMRLFTRFYQEPRPGLISQLQYANKDNLEVEIVNFVGADLRDNVSVRVEAGSSLPRSKMFEQEIYKQFIQGGLFGPVDPQSNPIGNKEILDKFGIKSITTPTDADVEKAQWINGILLAVTRGQMSPESIPPIAPHDNVQIHLQMIEDFMKKPGFKDPMGVFAMRVQELGGLVSLEQKVAQQQQQIQQQEQQLMMNEQQMAGMPPEGLAPPLGEEPNFPPGSNLQMGGALGIEGMLPQ